MDTYQRIALAVAVFGVGAGVATRVFDMSPVVKSIVGDGAIALMVSGVGIFVFACLSVEVRRNLHLMSREERQRWCRAEQEIALLTSPEKIGLWMYLENAHEKESRIREELQHRSMEVPNYELFRKLHKTTSFMRLEFGGSEGVRPEWWGIVREL